MERYTDNLKITDFIMAWKYDHKIIDDLVEYFLKNKHLWSDGKVGSGLNKEVKESQDCTVDIRFDHPFYNYFKCLQKSFEEYCSEYECGKFKDNIKLRERPNFQYYKPGAGFKKWHTERTIVNADQACRAFVFMTYLNDVPEGGTDFFYQQLTIPAKKGLTIIWPAEWTHTHKGQITKKHEKMIFTGWFSFPKFNDR